MRTIQILTLFVIVLFFKAFNQGSTSPAKVSTQVQTRVPSATPTIASVLKTDSEQAVARFEMYRKCDSTYGAEIRKRTGNLQKIITDLTQKERMFYTAKYRNNENQRKQEEKFRVLHAKDSLAYADTSANRMQRRKDVQKERIAAMKSMQIEEAKIHNDPELLETRKTIAALQKQIEDSIAVIIKDDQKCRECYILPE